MKLGVLLKAVRALSIFATATTLAFAQNGRLPEDCSFRTVEIPGAFSSTIAGTNDAGAMAGSFSAGLRSEPQGFLLFHGNFTSFSFPGSADTAANDVNNRGRIVGNYDVFDNSTNSFVSSGFVLDPHSGFQSVQVPQSTFTSAGGLNDSGDIVGQTRDASQTSRGFLLRRGHFKQFVFPGATATDATGINNEGAIVGTYQDAARNTHGYVLKHGRFRSIDFPGATVTVPWKINDKGTIVGTYTSEDVEHGFLWSNGVFKTTDSPQTTQGTDLRDLSNRNTIVGNIKTSVFSASSVKAQCRGRF